VRLHVIVVAYQSRDLVRACLRSLEQHPPQRAGLDVTVVDNASGDGTADAVRAEFGWVEMIELDDNVGFSAANNLVLRGTDAEFVLLLNPDTEVRAGSLDHVLDAMSERPEVAVAGPRLVLRDGTFDHAAKRSFPSPLAALAHFTGLGHTEYRAPELGERDSGYVEAVNGAFMMVRREALHQVGLLDEGYWLYMEDLDWCARFQQAGWRTWYEGEAEVLHVKGGTSGSWRRLRQNVAFHRGMGRFYRRFQAGRRPALDLLVYSGIGVKLFVSVMRSSLARRVLGQ
jgi:GT2 family glycosyltransferase